MNEIGYFDALQDFAAVPPAYRAEISERLMRRSGDEAYLVSAEDVFMATLITSIRFVQFLWDDGYLSVSDQQALSVALAESLFDRNFVQYGETLHEILEVRMDENFQ